MTEYINNYKNEVQQYTDSVNLNNVIGEKNIITFSEGLIGLSSYKKFYIEDLENEINPDYKSLQSTEQMNISFIILPIVISKIYDQEDIHEVTQILGANLDDLIAYTIVNLQIEQGNFVQYVNLKAPIIINKKNSSAVQYIFKNNKYEIKHKL